MSSKISLKRRILHSDGYLELNLPPHQREWAQRIRRTMPRWNKAAILLPNGKRYHCSSKEARKLAAAGLANLVSKEPLLVRLIPVRSVGKILVPEDCKRFLEDVVQASGYQYKGLRRTKKPSSAIDREYAKTQRQLAKERRRYER